MNIDSHSVPRELRNEMIRKDAEIARLLAENTNLRGAMDSIRSIVLASRSLEQQRENGS